MVIKASEYSAEIRVIKYLTPDVVADASVDGFRKYFLDRLNRLRSIIVLRSDMRDAISIAEAKYMKDHVKVVGLVYEKRNLSKNVILLKLEDESGMVDVVITSSSKAFKLAKEVLLDSCIGVEGNFRNGRIYAESIILPDVIPPPKPKDLPDIGIAFLSDLHVGSSLFLEKSLLQFIKWLRGELNIGHDLAESIKYVIIAGDLVDGVGIYPGQDKELKICSLHAQYESLSKLLAMLPDHIEVIVIPGNHDATTHAVPYVPLFKEYAEPLYELPNVHIFGDPLLIEIHGIKILVTHGRSLDDIISSVPGASFSCNGVLKAMQCMVRLRHLAPIYGGKTPLLPLDKDLLVIDTVPHIIHMGHVHVYGIGKYKGVILMNTGTWQEQTAYQKTMGIVPTTGIVGIIKLKDMSVKVMKF
ncbi:MAG: DNA-directed DNA polymerase II small subunit [Thermoprotei archaeon]|nr:DNA-directed DNA polymerase II small subunit [Thermoprotei archaeon]